MPHGRRRAAFDLSSRSIPRRAFSLLTVRVFVIVGPPSTTKKTHRRYRAQVSGPQRLAGLAARPPALAPADDPATAPGSTPGGASHSKRDGPEAAGRPVAASSLPCGRSYVLVIAFRSAAATS